jgi:hypothetical protein
MYASLHGGGTGIARHSCMRMVLTVCFALPDDEFLFVTVALRIERFHVSAWADKTSARLDTSNGLPGPHVYNQISGEATESKRVLSNKHFRAKPIGAAASPFHQNKDRAFVLAKYPNQPAHEADDVDVLIARMLPDRFSYVPFIEMINALDRDVCTGRTNIENLPSLKNCMSRNWRVVHGVGAPLRKAA